MASSNTTPPALLEATRNSTVAWQDDLQALFDGAKERFPDVVWELHAAEGAQGNGVEEVWGHKGVFQSSKGTELRWISVPSLGGHRRQILGMISYDLTFSGNVRTYRLPVLVIYGGIRVFMRL